MFYFFFIKMCVINNDFSFHLIFNFACVIWFNRIGRTKIQKKMSQIKNKFTFSKNQFFFLKKLFFYFCYLLFCYFLSFSWREISFFFCFCLNLVTCEVGECTLKTVWKTPSTVTHSWCWATTSCSYKWLLNTTHTLKTIKHVSIHKRSASYLRWIAFDNSRGTNLKWCLCTFRKWVRYRWI